MKFLKTSAFDPAVRYPELAKHGIDGVRLTATSASAAVAAFASVYLRAYYLCGDLNKLPIDTFAFIGGLAIVATVLAATVFGIGIQVWVYFTGNVPAFFAYPHNG